MWFLWSLVRSSDVQWSVNPMNRSFLSFLFLQNAQSASKWTFYHWHSTINQMLPDCWTTYSTGNEGLIHDDLLSPENLFFLLCFLLDMWFVEMFWSFSGSWLVLRAFWPPQVSITAASRHLPVTTQLTGSCCCPETHYSFIYLFIYCIINIHLQITCITKCQYEQKNITFL